jgi:hypothetical protein
MRTTNRILSIVLALVLIVGGLVLAVEAAVVVAHEPPVLVPRDRWHAWGRGLRLDSSQFLIIAGLVAVLGLVLLVLQLRRWRPDLVQTRVATGTPIWISRASIERRVDAAAERVGVNHARCTVQGKPAHWRVRLGGVAGSSQSDMVMRAVRAELDRLYAPRDTQVSLALRLPARRAR